MRPHLSSRNLEARPLPAHETYFGGVAGRAHNETAFHYILDIERRRAARAEQSLVLVLVRQVNPGKTVRVDPATAADVFAALGESVREADFVGWYRQGLVAGAVLIQPPDSPGDVRRLVAGRVADALRSRNGQDKARFRVLAFSLRGKG